MEFRRRGLEDRESCIEFLSAISGDVQIKGSFSPVGFAKERYQKRVVFEADLDFRSGNITQFFQMMFDVFETEGSQTGPKTGPGMGPKLAPGWTQTIPQMDPNQLPK